MNTQDSLTLIFMRNAFYKKLCYLTLATLVLCIVVIGILISILFFLVKNPIKPLYFATDSVGRLIQDPSLDQSNMSTEEITAWAIEAVQAAYTYNYVNYRFQLQNTQKYFTTYGWQNYMQALTASNNLLAVTDRSMLVLARVVGQPTILAQGILAGAYAWKIKLPILITNWLPPYDERSKFANALTVTMIIQRQPILESYKGVGIIQIVGEVVSSSQPTEISNIPTT